MTSVGSYQPCVCRAVLKIDGIVPDAVSARDGGVIGLVATVLSYPFYNASCVFGNVTVVPATIDPVLGVQCMVRNVDIAVRLAAKYDVVRGLVLCRSEYYTLKTMLWHR